MDFTACSETLRNKIVTASENNRKLIINNLSEKKIDKIKVDGCLITDHRVRCDYMFEIDRPLIKVIYLELKGCDIKKAYDQLYETISIFEKRHQGLEKECHIVASRVPKAGPQIQQYKTQLLKNKKAKLIVSTIKATISI